MIAAGEPAYDRELTGETVSTLETKGSSAATACIDACKGEPRCAAVTSKEQTCTLLGKVTGIRESRASVAWVNPDFDFRPPPPIPLPGVSRRSVQLVGKSLSKPSVPKRGAERNCRMACEDDWSCQGFTVDTWNGRCELFASIEGAKWTDDKQVFSSRAYTRVAHRPAPGRYSEDNKLAGKVLRTLDPKSTGIRGCQEACVGEAKCKGLNIRRTKKAGSSLRSYKCELLGSIGEAKLAKNWTAYVSPPRPSSPTERPGGHPSDQPAYVMTTTVYDPRSANYLIDVKGLVDSSPLSPVYKKRKGILVDWTSAFVLHPSSKGNVEIHTWYKSDLVLKASNKGEVVVGKAGGFSQWRIEYLFEYLDPPLGEEELWFVVREAKSGFFLKASPSGKLELTGDVNDANTHWRFDTMRLPTEPVRKGAFPVIEPEPTVLDERVIETLTNWAVEEYIRQQQPVCYKEGVVEGPCPSGQDTDCGIFCSQDSMTCFLKWTEIVQSVSDVALNIAGAVLTAGTANAGLRAARVAQKGATLGLKVAMRSAGRKLRKNVQSRFGAQVVRLIKSKNKSKEFKKIAKKYAKAQAKSTAKKVVGGPFKDAVKSAVGWENEEPTPRQVEALAEAYSEAVAQRAAEKIALAAAAGDDVTLLEVAAMLDPTGVSAVVDAFHEPVCTETPMPELSL